MSVDKQRFGIRASASRLSKGLLAIPQKFSDLFPDKRGPIEVIFDDDEKKTKALTFHPHDPAVKESRIFGLAQWFSERSVRPGDVISITVEDRRRSLYRIALDRYVQERQEQKARQNLRSAETDSDAERELDLLSRLTSKKPRKVAHEELLRIVQESTREPRPSAPLSATAREGVPAGIRILLRELHDGKCQLCAFTFQKRNGEPYFEIHHLDPRIGHHPTNLLVVCPNCHAQFEHATITDLSWAGGWLVSLAINGTRVAVRQPLAHDSIRRMLLSFLILVAAIRFGRVLRNGASLRLLLGLHRIIGKGGWR